MPAYTLRSCFASLLLIFGGAAGWSADPGVLSGEAELPSGLEAYVEARVLEANGDYREAMESYQRAMGQAPDSREVRLAYANLLLNVGMSERALDLFQGLGELNPEELQVKALALAQLSSRRSEMVSDAETALRAAVAENPDDPNLLFALAQILQRQGKLDEAEEIVSQLHENRPGNSRLAEINGDLLRATGRDEDAVPLYAECAMSGGNARSCRDKLVSLLVELGRPGDAGEAMLTWLQDIELDSLMRAAGLLWEGGRLDRSLETVQRVLARAPDAPRALTMEAHLLSALGRHQEAVNRLEKLLRSSPEDLDLMLAMAWSQGRSGNMKEARAWLDRAWKRSSHEEASRNADRCSLLAARLELLAGNTADAREWLDRVSDVRAAGGDYVSLLAEIYRRNGESTSGVAAMVRTAPLLEAEDRFRAEAAEAEFRLRLDDPRAWDRLRPLLDSDRLPEVLAGLQVLQTAERWRDVQREAAVASDRFPDNRDILFARAAAHERLGEAEAASSLFLKILESDPEDAAAANYLGYMWADRGENLDRALDLINRAVAADPENVAYLDSLGWVYFRRGDLDEAERWLRRAIELGGDVGDGTILCHLGEVLLAREARDEGRRLLLLGLDMGCDDPGRVRSLLDED